MIDLTFRPRRKTHRITVMQINRIDKSSISLFTSSPPLPPPPSHPSRHTSSDPFFFFYGSAKLYGIIFVAFFAFFFSFFFFFVLLFLFFFYFFIFHEWNQSMKGVFDRVTRRTKRCHLIDPEGWKESESVTWQQSFLFSLLIILKVWAFLHFFFLKFLSAIFYFHLYLPNTFVRAF